jgi:hypothetical protein
MSKYPNPDELPELDEIPDLDDGPAPEEEAPQEEAPEEPPPEAPSGGLRLHHLEVICQGCRVRVRLNDMPFADLVADDPDQPEWYAPPANPFLVGADNVVEVAVEPLGAPDDPRDALEAAEIELAVRHFAKGDPVAPGAGDALLEVRVHDELRAHIREAREREARGEDGELELPQTFFYVFDNDRPDFSAEISDAEPYDDEAALRDYAIQLRDLAVAGDAAGLVAEMEPKIQAYVTAYEEPRDFFRDHLLEGLRDEFLPSGIEAGFERDDVELEPCCGGRIWALYRPGRQPLLQTPPTPEGSTKQLQILVAPREGGPKIVR